MLKKVRPMWDNKQVFVIYANDFNLTKTTCITLNTEHFFFYKNTVANQCITMVFVLKTFQKKDIHA